MNMLTAASIKRKKSNTPTTRMVSFSRRSRNIPRPSTTMPTHACSCWLVAHSQIMLWIDTHRGYRCLVDFVGVISSISRGHIDGHAQEGYLRYGGHNPKNKMCPCGRTEFGKMGHDVWVSWSEESQRVLLPGTLIRVGSLRRDGQYQGGQGNSITIAVLKPQLFRCSLILS